MSDLFCMQQLISSQMCKRETEARNGFRQLGTPKISTHIQKHILSCAQSLNHPVSNSNPRTLKATASLKLSDLFLPPSLCHYLQLCTKVASTLDFFDNEFSHMKESAQMNLGETPAFLIHLVTVAPLRPETRIINPVANLHNDGLEKIEALQKKRSTNSITKAIQILE